MADVDLYELYLSTNIWSNSTFVLSASAELRRCSAINFSKRKLICKAWAVEKTVAQSAKNC